MMLRLPSNKSNGAAIITALLVVVIATLTVSPLIWRIFSAAKTVEVLSSRDQAREIAVAGTDWSRAILREDRRVSEVDYLTEPWAVSLEDTRLSEDLQPRTTGGIQDNEAVLSGAIEDAQGRFNLFNLTLQDETGNKWRLAFYRLCSQLGVPSDQARLVISTVLRSALATVTTEVDTSQQNLTTLKPPTPAPLQRWEDFRYTTDLSDQAWAQLKPYVVWLPQATPVNVNTAPAEVLYAAILGIDLSGALQLVSARSRGFMFRASEISSKLPGANLIIDPNMLDTRSTYFMVYGSVQVKQARVISQALLQRDGNKVYVLWRAEL